MSQLCSDSLFLKLLPLPLGSGFFLSKALYDVVL
jgi:hypothetical protein